MTPAKIFDGDLWVLAADATKMAEIAYQNGMVRGIHQERERAAKICEEWESWDQTAKDYCSHVIRKGDGHD